MKHLFSVANLVEKSKEVIEKYCFETDVVERKRYSIEKDIENFFEKDTDKDIEDYIDDIDFFIPADSIMQIVAFEMRRRLCGYRESGHVWDKSFEQSYRSIAHHLILKNILLISSKKYTKKIVAERSIEGQVRVGFVNKKWTKLFKLTINHPVNNKDVQEIAEAVKNWTNFVTPTPEIESCVIAQGFLEKLDLETFFFYFPQLRFLTLKNNKNLCFTSADQKAYKKHNRLKILRFEDCTFTSFPSCPLFYCKSDCRIDENSIEIAGKISKKQKRRIIRNTQDPLRIIVHEALRWCVPLGIICGWAYLCNELLWSLPAHYGQQDWQEEFVKNAAPLVKKWDKCGVEKVWNGLLPDLADERNRALQSLWKINDSTSLQLLSGAMDALLSTQVSSLSQCFSVPVNEIHVRLLNVVLSTMSSIDRWNFWINGLRKVLPSTISLFATVIGAGLTFDKITFGPSWFYIPARVVIDEEEEE